MYFFKFAKREQDFNNRPQIWLDDASVSCQVEINLERTIPELMFGSGTAFQTLLVLWVYFRLYK